MGAKIPPNLGLIDVFPKIYIQNPKNLIFGRLGKKTWLPGKILRYLPSLIASCLCNVFKDLLAWP